MTVVSLITLVILPGSRATQKLTHYPPARSNPHLDGAAQVRHHRHVETRCAQCGAAMTCQPEGGCWCAELPPIPIPSDAKGCLCEKCLRAKIEALREPGKTKQS
jgi:hypothetical protein